MTAGDAKWSGRRYLLAVLSTLSMQSTNGGGIVIDPAAALPVPDHAVQEFY